MSDAGNTFGRAKYVRVPTVAALLGVHRNTILLWIRAGTCDAVRPTPGSPWLVSVDWLRALRDQRK